MAERVNRVLKGALLPQRPANINQDKAEVQDVRPNTGNTYGQ
ncbi:hypothetical protein RAS12_10225 [Achromobacter seleniivolatilans]|uniref:Transposase n=1 Tax=Achromobacter seleniivolatilans TaxID=3047478 RepID=A0ABY9M7R0_9BURK|nr:hypothetical protein [Achromobacter sp. R39]WMD22725.1 hypothetical protein RAS12_10225 [Achromobacter sp. R39]